MSWYKLLGIYQQIAFELEFERSRVPSACPRDGTPLRPSPVSGELYCPFDGYRWPQDEPVAGK